MYVRVYVCHNLSYMNFTSVCLSVCLYVCNFLDAQASLEVSSVCVSVCLLQLASEFDEGIKGISGDISGYQGAPGDTWGHQGISGDIK